MMPEYIDKDDAYLDVCEHWDGDMLPGDFDDIIRAVPAADVAPVVHGEWLNGKTFLENAVCSNCNTTYEAYYSKYQYCPNCGAKMDGGESDN